jgi:hypothetical protein
MESRLNFFFPYERAAAWHENQLTRALPVVLRYSPMAHQVWLRMVAPKYSLQNLPKAAFATQRQRVVSQDAKVADGEAVTGISVWLAPDAAQISEPMTSSDRLQVLDAIITPKAAIAFNTRPKTPPMRPLVTSRLADGSAEDATPTNIPNPLAIIIRTRKRSIQSLFRLFGRNGRAPLKITAYRVSRPSRSIGGQTAARSAGQRRPLMQFEPSTLHESSPQRLENAVSVPRTLRRLVADLWSVHRKASPHDSQ